MANTFSNVHLSTLDYTVFICISNLLSQWTQDIANLKKVNKIVHYMHNFCSYHTECDIVRALESNRQKV